MSPKPGLLLLGIPLAACLALGAAAILLRPAALPEAPPARPGPAPGSPRQAAGLPPAAVLPGPAGAAAPPAPAEVSLLASDLSRVRGTYRNFRTAVVTGNLVLQTSLKNALRPNQDLALRFAQEDLSLAKNDADREIASRTLEALRRSP